MAQKVVARLQELLNKYLIALADASPPYPGELFVFATNCLTVMEHAMRVRAACALLSC